MKTTLSDQHELSKEMFAMLKELSSNKQDPEYKVSNQPHEAPPMKENVDSKHKYQEIDLDPSSVFYVDPTIASTVPLQSSLVNCIEIDNREEETIPEVDEDALHSPAKRRDFSVTEEINLEEKKEQKIPKRRK